MAPDDLVKLIEDDGVAAPGYHGVAQFEALIGARLPDDYRAFLASTPGGSLMRIVTFSLSGEAEGQEYLGRVAGLRREASYSIEERFRQAAANGVPEGLLSIMTDRGGNAIAIVLRQDRFGEIVFLDHEVGPDDARPSLEAAESADWVYAIPFAPTFSAFLAGLTADSG